MAEVATRVRGRTSEEEITAAFRLLHGIGLQGAPELSP